MTITLSPEMYHDAVNRIAEKYGTKIFHDEITAAGLTPNNAEAMSNELTQALELAIVRIGGAYGYAK